MILEEKAAQALGLVGRDGPAATLVDPATVVAVFELIYDAYLCVRRSHPLVAKVANHAIPPSRLMVRAQVRRAMPSASRLDRSGVTTGIMRMASTITADEVAAMGAEIERRRAPGGVASR